MTFNQSVIYLERYTSAVRGGVMRYAWGEMDRAREGEGGRGHLMLKSKKMWPSATHFELGQCSKLFCLPSVVARDPRNPFGVCCSSDLKIGHTAFIGDLAVFSCQENDLKKNKLRRLTQLESSCFQSPASAGRWGVVTCPLFTGREVNLFFKPLLIYNPGCL